MIEDLATNIQSLTAFDGVPVDPVIAKVGATEAVSLAANDGQGLPGFNGNIGLRDSTIDVNIYADTYGRMLEMKDTILDTYDGFSGTIGTTLFKRMKVVNVIETADSSSNPILYRAIVLIDVTI